MVGRGGGALYLFLCFMLKTVVSLVSHGQAGRCDVTDLPNWTWQSLGSQKSRGTWGWMCGGCVDGSCGLRRMALVCFSFAQWGMGGETKARTSSPSSDWGGVSGLFSRGVQQQGKRGRYGLTDRGLWKYLVELEHPPEKDGRSLETAALDEQDIQNTLKQPGKPGIWPATPPKARNWIECFCLSVTLRYAKPCPKKNGCSADAVRILDGCCADVVERFWYGS